MLTGAWQGAIEGRSYEKSCLITNQQNGKQGQAGEKNISRREKVRSKAKNSSLSSYHAPSLHADKDIYLPTHYTHTPTPTSLYTHTHTPTAHTHIHTHTHTHTHIHTHTNTHTHTQTHTPTSSL